MNPDTILVDRYQIREQLSQKAGRRTFLALDLQSQDLVIIKILRFDVDFQWDDLKLFEREAATLKNLVGAASPLGNRPEIPKYLDYFDVDEPTTRGFALVQTYIDAPSLETVIKQGRKFSEAEAIELADRLLSILIYLHEQHPPVIHRDIKPSNILLGNRSGNSIGDVYLVDFGSVQTAASKDGGTITIVGSYGYIPLEQFGGQTRTVSDLYSLGMTIIYLLTGIHPAELSQVNGQVKFTAEIDNHFRRWLEKMTQPYLDKRFESAKIARSSLESKSDDNGDFIHFRPPNSQIKLLADRNRLEILLSSRFVKVEYIDKTKDRGKFPNKIAHLLYLFVAAAILIITFPSYLMAFIFILIVAWMMASFLSPHIVFKSHCNCRVVIDDTSICVDRVKDREIISKVPRSESNFIIYNPGYFFDEYLDSSGRTKNGQVVIAPELYIESESMKYLFGNGLSQAELYWLGQELSSFMNIELQVIYPTPKEPPETSLI
jgi:serine/threonine protein kinase